MAVERNITVDDMFFLGEDKVIEGTVYKSDGTPEDITGWDLRFVLSNTLSGTPDKAKLTKVVGTGITITNAAMGEYQIQVDAADTDGTGDFKPTAGTVYYYSVKHVVSGGENILTFGTIEFRASTQKQDL